MTRVFLDTNILIYAYSANDPRMEQAQRLVCDGGAISIQCLNEFASVALRKLGMNWTEMFEAIEIIRAFCQPLIVLDADLHALGLRIAEDYRLSVYDGMIVAAARIAECDILYSEDMHHGLIVDGMLRIANPFAAP